jgi:FtsP/CotA-like multicopper oxidase with cupredoxin domain
MYTFARKSIRFLLALVLAVAGFALTGLHASAAPVTINLCASTGSITMPDSTSVPVWGFVLNPGSCTAGLVTSLPGPVLEVHAGDVVTVNLAGALPAGHTASVEIPGLSVSPVAGGYQFTASRVGTFVYQSDADAGRQMAMGLYGALVVRPVGEPAGFASGACSANPGSAYGGNAFDRECLLVLSQVDPAFNAAPDTFDMNNYLATYWLINGKAYPDASLNPLVSGAAGQKLLLRYVNAGYDNTAMMLLGAHQQVLARDAYPWNHPFLASTEIIPAGGTEDALVTVPSSGAPSANGFPLFNRNLHVTSGSPASAPGGMLTFIKP